MISLFLNTFSKWLHVALVKDGEVIDNILKSCGNDLSEEALCSIKNILEKNNYSIDDLTEIVCVKGDRKSVV